ncbi:MAG: hypothetical protein ACI9CF_000276 [Candidatus Omnitrophota bacterium]|jgi:hypothetical protein
MLKKVIFTFMGICIIALIVFSPTQLLKNYIVNEWSEYITFSQFKQMSVNAWKMKDVVLKHENIQVPFTEGIIVIKPSLDGYQISFRNWYYKDNVAAATLDLDWAGDLNTANLEFKIDGNISEWFNVEDSLSKHMENIHNFEIQYEDGYVEVQADHKKIFRATWVLRKQK